MVEPGELVFLSGGTGTPKLLQGFRALLSDELLTVIGNTGDDEEFYGLLVSPDIDTLLYLFAGLLDENKYWGVKGDSFYTNDFLRSLGEEAWFQLGDKDLALHLVRKKLLLEGKNATKVTSELSRRLHIQATILPMTNDAIRTVMITKVNNRKLTFQEYTVKTHEKFAVKKVLYQGSEKAEITPECSKALSNSKMIIIGPSNPITSIGPMLAVKGFKESLMESPATIVAISPIEGKRAFSGPAAQLLHELGMEASPVSIAKLYQEFLDIFILSETDRTLAEEIHALGIKTICTDINLGSKKRRNDITRLILNELK